MGGREAGELPWPLRYLVDEAGGDTGFAMLRREVGPADRQVYGALSSTHRVIGFTHCGPFPLLHPGYAGARPGAAPTDGWRRPEVEACEAWCHCFRRPEAFVPPGAPRFLVSGSDFVDIEGIRRIADEAAGSAKRWDVIYCCLPNWFNEMQKNWSLARRCLERLADEGGLSILAVGRAASPDVPTHPNIEVREQLPWRELLFHTARSRLAFLPNRLDASPRVITEALSLDVPVLVNAEILGGWKYVNDETGEFFSGEHDVVQAALHCLGGDHHPLDWIDAHHGKHRSARRLAGYLRSLGGADELDYALPADRRA